jgi:outer membrane protein OmpA-like peptidoglycan-associated protein
MATDWAADVKKYVANADDAAIAGIVRYCGIALRKVDSSLVAFSDKTETDRVRNNFLKKKLALTQSDAVLDKAIAKVGDTMKADRTKNRVTVYYLLAAEFKKLGLFVKADAKKAPAAKAPAAKAPAAKAAAKPAAKSAAKVAGAAVVAGAAAASKAAAKPAAKSAAKPAAKTATKAAAKPAAKTAAAKAAPAKAAAKLTSKKAPAKTQGLMGNAAKPAPKAEKPATSAVAGTIAAGAAVAGAAVAAASGAADVAKDTAAKAIGSVGDAAGAVAGAAGNAAGAAADKAGALFSPGTQSSSSDSEGGGMGWLLWLLAAALLLFALWWLFGGGGDDGDAAGAAPTEAAATLGGVAGGTTAPVADLAAAPAEGTVAIPAGAGVTTEMRDGKPVVKVYFDTSKTDVAPAFAATAGGLKGYLESNPGSTLAISGYSDPSGNAAANAELSKNRAQSVQAALVDAGIPAEAALLVKPENSADGSVSKEAARRVEVTVQ